MNNRNRIKGRRWKIGIEKGEKEGGNQASKIIIASYKAVEIRVLSASLLASLVVASRHCLCHILYSFEFL